MGSTQKISSGDNTPPSSTLPNFEKIAKNCIDTAKKNSDNKDFDAVKACANAFELHEKTALAQSYDALAESPNCRAGRCSEQLHREAAKLSGEIAAYFEGEEILARCQSESHKRAAERASGIILGTYHGIIDFFSDSFAEENKNSEKLCISNGRKEKHLPQE
jgi:hypothetical protein